MTQKPPSNPNYARNLAILVALLIATLAFLAGFVLRSGLIPIERVSVQTPPLVNEDWPTPPPTFTPLAQRQQTTENIAPTPTPLPPPTWTELGHLTSVKFNASTIVTEERQQLFGTDKIMLLVVGDVLMGIDLGAIKTEDVQIDGRTIRMRLPSATVTGVELRLDQSKIYDSNRAWIWSDYGGLEKNAIENAQRQLFDYSATNDSMLEMTEQLARLQLAEFLQKLGYKTVEISFKENIE